MDFPPNSPEEWSALAAIISGVAALLAIFVSIIALRGTNKSAKAAADQVQISAKQEALGRQQVRIAEAQERIAGEQQRAATWSIIAQMDEMLRQYPKERSWVRDEASKSDKEQSTSGGDVDFIGYMGVFERLSQLLDDGLLEVATAYNYYASRLRQLLKTKRARKNLTEHSSGWQLFIKLSLRMDDYGRDHGNPVIALQKKDGQPQAEGDVEPDDPFRQELETLKKRD
jgi:hypothetical protein